MLDHALAYARAGWPVLPLKERAKTPLTRHGLLDATTDEETIELWWNSVPDANIGLRTGITIDVLDIDGDAGLASLSVLAPGYKHPGPVASTGRGYHLLFAATGGKNGANLRPKLDFRGTNGYIVAPPSVHPSGSIYTWLKDPADHPLPAAPYWLLELLFPEPKQPLRSPRKLDAVDEDVLAKLDLRSELEDVGGRVVATLQSRVVMLCPFHAEDTASLSLYLANDTFYCFGCGAWGDALNVRRYKTKGALHAS